MKKKFFLSLLVMLVITIIAVSVSTVDLNSLTLKYGKKEFNSKGEVTGCSGTGTECMIVY